LTGKVLVLTGSLKGAHQRPGQGRHSPLGRARDGDGLQEDGLRRGG
jgi:hypothetical protein